jgi:hypothetical protein
MESWQGKAGLSLLLILLTFGGWQGASIFADVLWRRSYGSFETEALGLKADAQGLESSWGGCSWRSPWSCVDGVLSTSTGVVATTPIGIHFYAPRSAFASAEARPFWRSHRRK